MMQARVGQAVTGLPEGIEPSRLYPTKSQVGHVNEQQLAAIHEEMVAFNAYDTGPQWVLDNIQRNCPAPVHATIFVFLTVKASLAMNDDVNPANMYATLPTFVDV
jgi:hypothetical protein